MSACRATEAGDCGRVLALGLREPGLPGDQLQQLLACLSARCSYADALGALQDVQRLRASGRGMPSRNVREWEGQGALPGVQHEGGALTIVPVAACPGWELVPYSPATATMP